MRRAFVNSSRKRVAARRFAPPHPPLFARLIARDRRLIAQPVLDLVENAGHVVRIGAEVARVVPLELRLQLAADTPVGVAEVIVDHRVRRLEVDGLFQLVDRFVVAAEAIISPAQTVHDIAVAALQIDRPTQHAEGLVEIDALVDPGIAEVIQHQGLIRVELQRLLEIVFGARPILAAFIGDAAIIIQQPLVFLRLLLQGQRARIGRGGFREKLARALKIGQRRQRVRVLGMRVDHRLQMLARLLGLAERFEQQRRLHIRVDAQRVRFGHAVVKVYRGFFLLQPLVNIGEREGGQRIIGRERQRQTQIDQRRQFVALASAAERDESVKDFAGALLGVAHEGIERLAGVDVGQRGDDERVIRHRFVEGLVKSARGLVVAVARQEARIGVDETQHRVLGAQNRFEAPFRLGLVPADIGDQRRVIVAEHGEAFAVQFVEKSPGRGACPWRPHMSRRSAGCS